MCGHVGVNVGACVNDIWCGWEYVRGSVCVCQLVCVCSKHVVEVACGSVCMLKAACGFSFAVVCA